MSLVFVLWKKWKKCCRWFLVSVMNQLFNMRAVQLGLLSLVKCSTFTTFRPCSVEFLDGGFFSSLFSPVGRPKIKIK